MTALQQMMRMASNENAAMRRATTCIEFMPANHATIRKGWSVARVAERRERVLGMVDAGYRQADIAEALGVSHGTVRVDIYWTRGAGSRK